MGDTDDETGCVHLMLRGPRSGDCCGEKISTKSETGKYCTKHISHENKTKVDKKTKIKEKEDTKYRIAKNRFGNYTHSSTGLVFRSAKEKVVYGKQDDKGDIHDLTEDDIQMCKKYKFQVVKDTKFKVKEDKKEEEDEVEEGKEKEEDDIEEEKEEEEKD